MQAMREALKSFGTQFTATAGVFATVTGIFLYHVLADKTPECTCRDQTSECDLYMALPVCLIFIMSLWLDGSCQRVCQKHRRRFWSLLLPGILKAAFICLLWPLSVMMDGEWYICCIDDRKLACRNETTLTYEDRISMKELRNKSKLIGLGVLFGLTAVAAIITSVPGKRWWTCGSKISNYMQSVWDKHVPLKCKVCCTAFRSKISNCMQWFQRRCSLCTDDADVLSAQQTSYGTFDASNASNRGLFNKILLKQGETVVTEKLREAAKVKLTAKLDEYVADEDWDKFYDVVEELIWGKVPPGPSPSDPGQSESSRLLPQSSSTEQEGVSPPDVQNV